jgi:hypothetical protein
VDLMLQGGNGCRYAFTNDDKAFNSVAQMAACTQNIFNNVVCKTLTTTLRLFFMPANVANVSLMCMGDYLTMMGLNSLVYINGDLQNTVLNRNVQVSATFLPNLLTVNGTLSVDDCSYTQLARLFLSLWLQRVQWVNTLTIFGTGFTDMTSFSELQCVRRQLLQRRQRQRRQGRRR